MFTKLSGAYISSIVKPMVEDWLRVASDRYNGVISDATPDKIIIYINPYINTEVAAFSFRYDDANGFVYCFKINPNWVYMTPLDTIRNVIGHEVAHYVDFKMDLFKIGVDETIRKFNSSVEENGDGGHNNQFEHICKTIGVDDRFSLASYFPNGQERIIHSAKLFLINCGMFSVLCDEEYSQYHKQKHKNS